MKSLIDHQKPSRMYKNWHTRNAKNIDWVKALEYIQISMNVLANPSIEVSKDYLDWLHQDRDIRSWCRKTLSRGTWHQCHSYSGVWQFKNLEDALLFDLTWGQYV